MLQHGDGRAIGVSARKALFELGGVILAQQINPLTQKTPIGEAEHCLSNYRGSLQFFLGRSSGQQHAGSFFVSGSRASQRLRSYCLTLVLQIRVLVEYHQRALPLEIAHHARYAVLRRYQHQHVHVVGHQVPLDYLDALVLAEPPQDLADVVPDLVVDDFAPILRREHDVVLAHPLRVRQAVVLLGHGHHHLSDSDL